MAGRLVHNQEGSISPETLRRWTDNTNNVLATSRGRTNFRTYLEERKLGDTNLITFWEMCDQLAPEEVNSSQRTTDNHEQRSSFENEVQGILTFAEEHVNLDSGYLQRLHRAIEDRNHEKIFDAVREVKQAAVELLESAHHKFSQHLLGERGMLN